MCIRDRCGWGRRRPTDLQRLGRGATLPRFDLPQTPPFPQSTPALSPKTPTNPSDEADFLAGSDLSGASLPELLGWAGELELLRSKESVAQSLFLSMLAATIYIILAVIDTNDLALITNSTTLSLPILNISVPVIPFYVVAPVVLCVVFIYFCFLQRETIDLLRRMPLVMPEGSMPATKAFSWLPLDDGHLLSPHKPHRSLLGSAISAVDAYGPVPSR